MPRFDEGRGECHVFTFRDGLLSAVGHDLKLRFGAFSLEVSEDMTRVQGSFDTRTLRVENAMRGKSDDRTALSIDDKRTINQVIAKEVLRTEQHPMASFRSIEVSHLESGVHVEGELTLLGVHKRVACTVQRAGDFLSTEITLFQPDFGITPYTALLGTLRVKPHVTVRIVLPAR